MHLKLAAGLLPWVVVAGVALAQTEPSKDLPIPGEVLEVQGRTAYLITPEQPAHGAPWVWHAPTLPGLPGPEEKWMLERFTEAGIAVAGIDAGESYGSPEGRALYTALYEHLVQKRGLSKTPCLLARSRGGLMLYNWAVEHPHSVACIAGIYPVCNLRSYPGLDKACGAYGMTEEQLAAQLDAHNPVSRVEPLAKAGVPILHIHGDSDTVVPLEANSAALAQEYERHGGKMDLVVIEGQGHNMWPGWFQCQELLDFVIAHATGPWPPARTVDEILDRRPMRVPWLDSPRDVVTLKPGRQLFVDDYLIAETTLKRQFHTPRPHAANPLVRPDKPWEQQTDQPKDPRETIAFSDGVWFDPSDGQFKMWYESGRQKTCYTVSRDGIHWDKPALDVQPGTNIVMEGKRDSCTIWLDHLEEDPARRFKMMRCRRDIWPGYTHSIAVSPDGIHWSEALPPLVAEASDRSTFFFNPFRKKWVYSVKDVQGDPATRYRRYYESAQFPPPESAGEETVPWVGADEYDKPREGIGVPPQLYNLDANAYESVLLGLFVIWQGNPPNYPARQKINEVFVGFSRDGFHWHRPFREPFIPVSEESEAWNYGNVQSVGGCCLVVGDQLRFYASGRMTRDINAHGGFSSTGLFTLRRDGFASMNADTNGGSLTTRPLRFKGAHLFVNVDASRGELRAELLDADENPIEPFTAARCESITTDSTVAPVRWTGDPSLESLSAQPVRIRFRLTNGKLYAFWTSPSSQGESLGYVAAGGPGFTGPQDTLGRGAYEAAAKTPAE